MHKSEMDMRNGAFRKFDIDEAIIKTSDRRIAEKASIKEGTGRWGRTRCIVKSVDWRTYAKPF